MLLAKQYSKTSNVSCAVKSWQISIRRTFSQSSSHQSVSLSADCLRFFPSHQFWKSSRVLKDEMSQKLFFEMACEIWVWPFFVISVSCTQIILQEVWKLEHLIDSDCTIERIVCCVISFLSLSNHSEGVWKCHSPSHTGNSLSRVIKWFLKSLLHNSGNGHANIWNHGQSDMLRLRFVMIVWDLP